MRGDKVLREIYELEPKKPALSTLKGRARRVFFGQGGHVFGKFRGESVGNTGLRWKARNSAEADCKRCGFTIHVNVTDSDWIRFYHNRDGGVRIAWQDCTGVKETA